jgi:dTDP-4-dehydrorhamnose 3,5-epimerase
MSMRFREAPINGVFLVDLEPQSDERGFFARYFCERKFSEHGLNTKWVQINNSMSREVGTLRGLHFQSPPHSEVKLVRCLRGAIWDVVVDLREGSETFGRWFSATLSAENRTMIYVSQGFAHGFVSLEPDSEILYLVSEYYTPESESTLIWNDSDVGIQWPIKPKVLSDKDSFGSLLRYISPVRIL